MEAVIHKDVSAMRGGFKTGERDSGVNGSEASRQASWDWAGSGRYIAE